VILETDRLIVKEVAPEDAKFFVDLCNSSTWLTYIGDRGIACEEDASHYITTNLVASYNNHGFGLYMICLKVKEVPLGICGFVKRDYLPYADLGFALMPQYEGYGYAFEAAKSLLYFGEHSLGLTTVLALTTKDNLKSQRLLQKVGFKQKGMLNPEGKMKEFLLYSLSKVGSVE
jgi:RimJ/RimL family protein N-acetyltransferase